MKIPQRAPARPNFPDPKRYFEILKKVTGPSHNGRYLHWDKLRRLTPPRGITSAEWWYLLKMRRSSLLKPLPLRDSQQKPFQIGLPDPIPELLHGLDKDAAGQILMTEKVTNPDTRDRYVITSLMEEAITSSQLEGAATTRVIAKEMLRTGRAPRDRGEQMIANNYAAMRKIQTLKEQPLTPEVVRDLHRVLTESAIDQADAVGRFRRPDEDVRVYDSYNEVLHTPPAAEELPKRVAAMCDFANGKTPDFFLHPVVRAIVLHFWLAYDHPFVDGNGRCARALFYWSMLRSGYWLCEFISISQLILKAPMKYGRAFLYTETDANDLTYFTLYHLELIRDAINELHEYLSRKMTEVRGVERLLRDSEHINHRQLALLSHALRHPDIGYTIASHRASHGTVYETARKDLFELEGLGLLESRKRGKTFYFYPARDLEDRMRKLRRSR